MIVIMIMIVIREWTWSMYADHGCCRLLCVITPPLVFQQNRDQLLTANSKTAACGKIEQSERVLKAQPALWSEQILKLEHVCDQIQFWENHTFESTQDPDLVKTSGPVLATLERSCKR